MNNNISPLSKVMISLDNFCDYVPFVSTLTNLIDIFGKGVLKAVSYVSKETSVELGKNRYFKHIRDEKTLETCVYLAIPFYNTYFKINSEPAISDEYDKALADAQERINELDRKREIETKRQNDIKEPVKQPLQENRRPPVSYNPTTTQILDDFKKKSEEQSKDTLARSEKQQAECKQKAATDFDKTQAENALKIKELEQKILDLENGDKPDRIKAALIQLNKSSIDAIKSAENNTKRVRNASGDS